MSYFLWVEDFENDPKVTASNVFGGILDSKLITDDRRAIKKLFKEHGIFVELNFQDALNFIGVRLNDIDYIILDIDLPAYGGDGPSAEVLGLLENFENYCPNIDEVEDEVLRKKACAELKKIAGFYLYTKLVVELGFSKTHILFCSNHGENTKSIQGAFKTAKIYFPKIYLKSNEDIRRWVEDCFNNPYSKLRRGIIEGCRFLKSKINSDSIYFNNYVPKQDHIQIDNISSYFEILEKFLPLREPEDKQSLYKLFVRTLSHEWEAAKNIRYDQNKPDAVLAWVMRNARHWVTHNSALFSDIDEQLIAYLFILNIRVMFNWDNFETLKHEEILFGLFDRESFEKDDFLKKDLPISDTYLALRNLIKNENQRSDRNINIEESFYFNEMANNVQLSNSIHRNDKNLFMKLLYQMYWLVTCNPYVDKKNSRSLEIKFWNFNYSDKPYMLELARHIYHRSFPEA